MLKKLPKRLVRRNRYSLWKSYAALAMVLLMGAAGACVFFGRLRERKEFFSKADPASGVQCRFTVSSAWQNIDEKSEVTADPSDIRIDYTNFASPLPSPLWQWIESRIFHHMPSERSQIILSAQKGRNASDLPDIEDGYPEPEVMHHDHIVSVRRLRIDGYPATIAEMAWNSPVATTSFRWRSLRVYVPEQSILYMVFSEGEPPASHKADDEMQAIIASFRIVHNVAPAGRQR